MSIQKTVENANNWLFQVLSIIHQTKVRVFHHLPIQYTDKIEERSQKLGTYTQYSTLFK